MKCQYCEGPARLILFGGDGYPYQRDYGPEWVCAPCQAWCGCHPGTEKPLGRLANAQLRLAKQAAHEAFDPMWKRVIGRDGCSKTKARRAGYKWLAEQLGISPKHCHMGYMDLEQCERVVQICRRFSLPAMEPA